VHLQETFGPLNSVCYLIFEIAEGDIRKHRHALAQFDLAWCLRSMHNTAVGLDQLHYSGIAHQDLKPSNILVFPKEGSKIADLGRATDALTPFVNDTLHMPGDPGYAPPEQFYGFRITDDFERRKAADLYLLGSIFFFFFSDVAATPAIEAKLQRTVGINLSSMTFEAELPYIRNAFIEALNDLEKSVTVMAGGLTRKIMQIVEELCDPDPRKRGDTKRIGTVVSQYSLERYISRLNILARHAELGLMSA
jgi:serine/threonine protein kinase